MKIEPGYETLAAVLQEALDQAQAGKGKERHQQANRPFDRQPIVELARMVGPAGPAQQVMKKTQEAMRLPPDRAVVELLGAINYAAATIMVIRENANAESDYLVVQSRAPINPGLAPFSGGGFVKSPTDY